MPAESPRYRSVEEAVAAAATIKAPEVVRPAGETAPDVKEYIIKLKNQLNGVQIQLEQVAGIEQYIVTNLSQVSLDKAPEVMQSYQSLGTLKNELQRAITELQVHIIEQQALVPIDAEMLIDALSDSSRPREERVVVVDAFTRQLEQRIIEKLTATRTVPAEATASSSTPPTETGKPTELPIALPKPLPKPWIYIPTRWSRAGEIGQRIMEDVRNVGGADVTWEQIQVGIQNGLQAERIKDNQAAKDSVLLVLFLAHQRRYINMTPAALAEVAQKPAIGEAVDRLLKPKGKGKTDRHLERVHNWFRRNLKLLEEAAPSLVELGATKRTAEATVLSPASRPDAPKPAASAAAAAPSNTLSSAPPRRFGESSANAASGIAAAPAEAAKKPDSIDERVTRLRQAIADKGITIETHDKENPTRKFTALGLVDKKNQTALRAAIEANALALLESKNEAYLQVLEEAIAQYNPT